jgi:sugar phosphate isomerase/epimerase
MAAKRKTAKKAKGRLAAQLFTLRDHLKDPKAIAKTLKRVRKIGYRNVQISGTGPVDPIDLRRMLEDADLKAIGYHTSMGELRERFVDLVDKLHAWDCRYAAVAFLGPEERKNAAGYRQRAREMTRFGRQLAEEGITLQYHNHSFEFVKFRTQGESRTGLSILYRESDPQALQAEIDTYWVAHGGGDPAGWIECLEGRLDQVHLKDGVMTGEGTLAITEVGEGNLNWPRILEACRKAGTVDYIVEQDANFTRNSPFTSLKISYENLAEMGLE